MLLAAIPSMRALPVLLVLHVLASAPAAAAERVQVPAVRALDAFASDLLATGREGSPTFARLLGAIERSGVIVYIDVRMDPGVAQSGRLEFCGCGAGQRFLRVRIDTGTTAWHHALLRRLELVAILGHELQHVLEVANDPTVDSPDAFESLYHAIGITLGPHAFDTEAAQRAGHAVLWELRDRVPRAE